MARAAKAGRAAPPNGGAKSASPAKAGRAAPPNGGAEKNARQLAGFIAKFTPELATRAHAILAKVRGLVPGAIELVYDNYNALAIGFASSEKMSGLVFSIALYPRWVSLFFMGGPNLPDPHGLLQGEGSMVRHIVLEDGAATLDRPAVRALLAAALYLNPIDPSAQARIVIKSVSAKQRPRRPVPKATSKGKAAKAVAAPKAKPALKAVAAPKAKVATVRAVAVKTKVRSQARRR